MCVGTLVRAPEFEPSGGQALEGFVVGHHGARFGLFSFVQFLHIACNATGGTAQI